MSNRRDVLKALGAAVALASGWPRSAGAAVDGGPTVEAIKKRGALKVGWGIWFPYLYRDPNSKQLTGISTDIFTEMARSMNVRLEFVEDSWSTLIAGLQAGKFDTAVPLAITAERQKAVDFSAPIAKETTDMVVRKEDVGKYSSWRELDVPGKKITTTLGSNTQFLLQRSFKNAELVLVKAGPDSISALASKRADAWAAVHSTVKYALKEHPQLGVIPGEVLAAEPIAFIVKPGDAGFKAWLNEFVGQMKTSGALLKIFQKYELDVSSMPD